ncbi:helix-turn-helix transcriptional regulator [Paenibacillus thiaminolyticus]|uniref:helix-turn-helix domain-containing protein n=1 Tax=Paenibacillus thiaminolyticus TaxID=49283 RepID=UPI0013F64346|nr:helix-turn-helix transcriptional regulator [Paenibacillus thiaminolyticus]NGP58767.1 helix-turn-helix transcriptional regulator [Paenibacillus thiaminolyticus]NGP60029.1 helix-turn-helix transcriptional regulator [Paenibacillus thiaminolyticus]
MIGKRLKHLRKKENLNQHEMAATFGMSRSTYAGYENDDREPDFQTLIMMARYFGVTTDYLFGVSDIPFAPYTMTSDEVKYIERSLDMYREIKNEYLQK